MSYIDDTPPKHTDAGTLNNPDKLSIYSTAKNKSLDLDGNIKTRRVYFTLEEKAILAKKEGFIPRFGGEYPSKKSYLEALETKRRAQQYLAEEKCKSPEISKEVEEDILSR